MSKWRLPFHFSFRLAWAVMQFYRTAARASKLATSIVSEFTSLVSDRELPSGMICDTLMLTIGALWKIRMIRDGQVRSDRKVIEPLMASHILNLIRSMLKVSKKQLEEKPEDETDLAQKITAAFRRLLPALRIGSKWLRSNCGFLGTSLAAAATSDAFSATIKSFWEAYALFFSALKNAFPREKLPQLIGPLEEDVYMSGFSPIKKDLLQCIAPTENGLAPGQDTVHPNEEYLMRLSDLWDDFHLLNDAEVRSRPHEAASVADLYHRKRRSLRRMDSIHSTIPSVQIRQLSSHHLLRHWRT